MLSRTRNTVESHTVGRSAACAAARAQWAGGARACQCLPSERVAPHPRPRPPQRPLRVTPDDGLSIKTSRREHSHAVTTQPRSLVHPADTRHTLHRETLDAQRSARKEAIITSDKHLSNNGRNRLGIQRRER